MGDVTGLAHVAVPSQGSGPPVLVIHSWWGLTPAFVAFAERLADVGFLAGCVDLFGGQRAATPEQARALRSTRRREPTYRTLQHALARLGTHPAATRPDPAVIGFSMGGHWAMWLAQHPPPEVAATVLFYAARAGDCSAMTSPCLAHFAAMEGDEFVSAASRRRMERALVRGGVPYEAYDYPAAGHWFAEPGQDTFDEAAAEQAFRRTVAFLDALRPA